MMKRSKTKESKSKTFKWLTRKEEEVLASGGYFDTENVLHKEDGCIRCTSINKATGQRCKNFTVPGETFCRFHGGYLARRKAGKERIYSAFIADPSIEKVYNKIVNDDEVVGIKEELSLLRALLAKLIGKIDFDDLNGKAVKEIAFIIGEVRQLVDDCTKTEIKLGQLIDIGKVTLIVNALAKIVSKYIKDEESLKAIADEFSRIPWPATLASTPQPVEPAKIRQVPSKTL